MTALIAALRAVAARPETRVVVLAGAGPVFSAGHDLREMVGGDLTSYRRLFDVCTQLMTAVQEIPHPVIARVHGMATAALAEQLARASTLTVAIGKQAFYAQIDIDQPKAYAYAKEVMSMNALAADAQEGMCAFLDKRPPQWRGR